MGFRVGVTSRGKHVKDTCFRAEINLFRLSKWLDNQGCTVLYGKKTCTVVFCCVCHTNGMQYLT